MRRILTIRTPAHRLPETVKPYIKNPHRIVYAVRGSGAIVAVPRSLIPISSLRSIHHCDELYVPPELPALRIPAVLPVPRSSYVAIVDGIRQPVDTQQTLESWRKSNPQWYGYRSKLDTALVG